MSQQLNSLNFIKFSGNNATVNNVKDVTEPAFARKTGASGNSVYGKDSLLPYNLANVVPIRTKLSSKEERQMYSEISSAISSSHFNISVQDGVSVTKKLDALLKSGKLLNASSNDDSSTLKNLYDILKTPRCLNLDNTKILSQVIDALYNPTVITQNFGDIPNNVKENILSGQQIADDVKANPTLMDVDASGTCVAASVEFHMANKHPAKIARWVSGLTSQN